LLPGGSLLQPHHPARSAAASPVAESTRAGCAKLTISYTPSFSSVNNWPFIRGRYTCWPRFNGVR
jgi:hypothetical protein